MKKQLRRLIVWAAVLFLPMPAFCQIFDGQLQGFHNVLEKLYRDMIPMVKGLLTVSQAIAGLGALGYIGVRVWKHIAAAEPIDFFPLFRPFLICMLIGLYPNLLGLLGGILKPLIIATKDMAKNSNNAVEVLLKDRAKAIINNEEWQDLAGGMGEGEQGWEKYEQQESANGGISKGTSFSLSMFSNTLSFVIKFLLSIVLQLIYFAAALCIDVMRTFNLLILSLLGPFVLCLSVFDGFQHLLTDWLARYINIYLWLPIANLFGAMISNIQAEMLKLDATQGTFSFSQTDAAYIIFLVISIVGYFSIPSIANYIIQVQGGNNVLSKTSKAIMTAGKAMAGR
jgi:conjugative transposon TraJ protein